METFLEKLSSYNILNNLLPGIVYCYLMESLLGNRIVNESFVENIFIYYFIGMIINRIGSVLVEPICKKLKIVKYAEYNKYLDAIKIDEKIEVLLETNNTYRSSVAVLLCVVISKIYLFVCNRIQIGKEVSIIIVLLGLIVLFMFAYRKQTNYIRNRVEKASSYK